MELASILQRRLSVVAILGISVFASLIWIVGDGVVRYASLYERDGSQVLGEKTTQNNLQCISPEVLSSFVTDTQKTVTLYAPDKSLNFELKNVASCFKASGCDAENFSCADGKVILDKSCVVAYFQKNPLAVEQWKVVSGVGAVAQVKVQDWTVNYENLAEQLTTAVSNEVKYCQVVGQADQTRQNLGNLQLVVSDELPSMNGEEFPERFVEIDASKEKLYFWNDGIYQTLPLVHGARLPKEAVYHVSDIDFGRILDGLNASYVSRNTNRSDYVVVHK